MEVLKRAYNFALKIKKYFAKNGDKFLFTASISFFVITIFHIICIRELWFDEVHAYNIARDLNFFEILKLSRHEGHLFLWYSILMPFAKFDIGYPYAMQICNFLFMFMSLIIMWKKAKFNPIAKTFITLSVPVYTYGVIARCYSLAIFLITLLCLFYNKRFKNPVIYSLSLVLLANTCAMGIIFASCFGFFYFVDIYKEIKDKKFDLREFLPSFLILVFGIFIVSYQIFNFRIPYYAQIDEYTSVKKIIEYFTDSKLYAVIPYLSCLFLSLILFFKRKQLFFIFAYSEIFLIYLLSFIYGGEAWHFNFIIVYLVSIFALYKSTLNKANWFDKTYEIIFTIFCIALFFLPKTYEQFVAQDNDFIQFIKTVSNKKLDKKIILYPRFTYIEETIPSLRKMGIEEIYSISGDKTTSFEYYYDLYKGDGLIEYDKLYELIKNDDFAYIFLLNDKLEDFENSKADFIKNNLNVDFVDSYTKINVYKLYKIK